ncbi:hypothetical protein O1611_g10322 [Lasiodiplodia mahajangana]|uniref:Uncharacterized protein n=1 Tax=Lasiodiplodia mahajangana TaxID=1108764 RepID=A0ACC2IZQ8_9PEZI|nr:hypothetical protein O1611_g10322 [Lasiodiplodia mahajangana]
MAALPIQPASTNPFKNPFEYPSHNDNTKDEWEDWDVDSDDSSAPNRESALIDLSGNGSGNGTRKSYKPASARFTQHRSTHMPRVKSRARQKAQNAKAGIKLVTDMSQFQQARVAANQGRFADTAALQALEGNPTSASVGNFSWLRHKSSARSENPRAFPAGDHSAGLSPDSRPIVIGISVPSDDAGSHQVSPHTAVVETPMDMRSFSLKTGGKSSTPQQLRSVWSPDTEVTESPYSARRPISSVYSQYAPYGGSKIASDAPPVPGLPAMMNFNQGRGLQDQDDEEGGSPYTLFEEDGSPVARRKSQKPKAAPSPGSAGTGAHGWWDHVTTPFTSQPNNPFAAQQQQTGSSSTPTPHEWWSGRDEKAGSSKAPHLTVVTPANPGENGADTFYGRTFPSENESRDQVPSEKARSLSDAPSVDAPPPYEYPKPHVDAKIAVSQTYVNPQRIPSPGPVTPGLRGAMGPEGGINLAEIPLTPSGVHPVPNAALPDRAVGSYKTGDHFLDARGKANKTERQRRRHEKEDVVARRIGGFWRGRGCIPEEGCFGRSGREGRKRRRICLGVLGGVIAAIILIIVLVVVLTKRAMSPAVGHGSSPGKSHPSGPKFWLNVTGFPPMPTGVLTVAGPQNPVAVSGCFTDDTPSTAWSCALPKEDQDSVDPYKPNQPEFIFQVQFDNNTRALWKLADKAGDSKNDPDEYVFDDGFKPDPAPPSLREMRGRTYAILH